MAAIWTIQQLFLLLLMLLLLVLVHWGFVLMPVMLVGLLPALIAWDIIASLRLSANHGSSSRSQGSEALIQGIIATTYIRKHRIQAMLYPRSVFAVRNIGATDSQRAHPPRSTFEKERQLQQILHCGATVRPPLQAVAQHIQILHRVPFKQTAGTRRGATHTTTSGLQTMRNASGSNTREQAAQVTCLIGPPATRNLIRNHTEGPHISCASIRLTAHHLRCHVVRCTYMCSACIQRIGKYSCDTKVTNTNHRGPTSAADKDVGSLQVTMDNAFGM